MNVKDAVAVALNGTLRKGDRWSCDDGRFCGTVVDVSPEAVSIQPDGWSDPVVIPWHLARKLKRAVEQK